MEEHASSGRENVHKYKNKFMGKLFKEKKGETDTNNAGDVDSFLYGPSDKLHMMPVEGNPSNPPPLSRIDTNTARRWPTAAEITNLRKPVGERPNPPRRSRKGLSVRFTNERPEMIGEGGDEATLPVSEIGARRRAQSHPPRQPPLQERPPGYTQNPPEAPNDPDGFRPGPLRRTQTGFESIPEQRGYAEPNRSPRLPIEEKPGNAEIEKSDPHDPTSFAARVKAEMRGGEGRALVQASPRTPDADLLKPADAFDNEVSPEARELHLNTIRNSMIFSSPDLPGQLMPGPPAQASSQKSTLNSDSSLSRNPSNSQVSLKSTNSITESPIQLSRSSTTGTAPQSTPLAERPLLSSRTPTSQGTVQSTASTDNPFTLSRTPTMQSAAMALGDEALQDFSSRVAHLYTLFRLSSESVKPISTCSLEEVVRAALWWFLKGRMNLEATARDRPTTPQAQQVNAFVRQQSYSDLGKSLWIVESVAQSASDLSSTMGSSDPYVANILEARQSVLSGLRKLTMSMKRNGLLPQEDAPLPQGIDNTIWVRDEGNRSLVASQRHNLTILMSDAFPLGDSNKNFSFGRMFVEGILEEEAASQHYRCPVLVSLTRGVKERELKAMIASQDGSLKMCIQADRNLGPIWDDVTWQSKSNSLKIGLPRGFVLRLHCSEQDYRTIWGTYDYQTKIHASMVQHRDEKVIFEAVLKSFRYIDQRPESRFPKEALPNCHIRVFEKTYIDKAATGVRTMHRGFRIALNTSPQTKTLRGIDQDLPPNLPIQFNFLRGEDGLPAMELKIDDHKSKYRMVLSFNDPNERARLQTLLTATALGEQEDVVAESLMRAFSIVGHSPGEKDLAFLKMLDWQNFRIFNEYSGDLQDTKAVLSDHLRVVLDFKTGSLTDRINVAPGELKLRLDVKSSKELKILRQPQEDMTVSVIESQVSRELPYELADLLKIVEKSQSTRTYLFPALQDLHLFQAALTGFVVLFDGMATSFNISRRRMVVPIYKKWDAASTRLQIVQREKVVQLVAFFENFSHGDCMNFALKSTDSFETSSRSGKHTLRIVDAKFAMPKARGEGEEAVGHEFVCLDMPDYPGEHDDITIIFETESELDRFAKALPAPTKIGSRMASVRR
ncbi:hypothetical protein LSUE1_G000767 [Lachnellula suecica]|uniref:Uncharacterized protein n=1 Tax=Lachnellula suecica TaxID=602035 RepID=A0A8T9CJ78_9HELO|nr:hypothetical protein LSUE1_G000767 [Lachnellula suecica]